MVRSGSPADEAQAATDGLPLRRRIWAVVALTAGLFIAVLDGIGINVALPLMAKDLAVSEATGVWVVTAYQLSVAASLFPFAALGDRIGYRRVYCLGLALFVIASGACALAGGIEALIAARAVQGLGGSALMAVNLALVRIIFPERLLGRGVAFNTLVVAFSAAAGPLVAGLVLTFADWRFLFLLNVPVGIAALAIAAAALPRSRSKTIGFDFAGAGMFALAICSVALLLDGVGRGWPAGVLAALAATILVLATVVSRHQMRIPNPVLAIDLLRVATIRLSALAAVCAYVVQGLVYVSLPFFLHDALGLESHLVGLSMAPWPIGIILASLIVGRIITVNSAARLGVVGLALLFSALCLLAFAIELASIAFLIPAMFLCGFGFGVFQSPNTMAIISLAPQNRSAAASALQSSSRLTGQAVGAALVSSLFGVLPDDGIRPAVYLAALFGGLALSVGARRLMRNPARKS